MAVSGRFEKRIPFQGLADPFLILFLLGKELRSFTKGRIVLAAMKSLAESKKMERNDQRSIRTNRSQLIDSGTPDVEVHCLGQLIKGMRQTGFRI